MPFTGSHPAAVLPFMRWGLPASALVIGSMAPDLPYYTPTPVGAELTHSVAGVIGVDVLLGAAVFVLWQGLVGPAAVAFSPTALRRRLVRPVPFGLGHHVGGLRRAALTALALALGAATHVAWDSFTHLMWGAEHVAWLVQTHGGRPGYEWAQYASGIVGGAAIAFWCARWWRIHPPTGPADPPVSRGLRATAWTALALSTVVGAGLGVRSGLTDATSQAPGLFFLAATKGGGAGAAAAVVLSLVWTLWSARRAGRPAGART